MTFSEKLQQLLEDREVTLDELADAIDVSIRTAKGWFEPRKRYSRPSDKNLSEICHVLEVDSDYFDDCFDDDYARMRSRNQRRKFTKWAGDIDETDED